MSLDWDVREVPKRKAAEEAGRVDEDWFGPGNPGEWQDVMIWTCLATGIGWKITEENLEEFRARIRFLEAMGQALTTPPIPDEVIDDYVGLKTNVSPVSRAYWVNRVFEQRFPKAPQETCPDCGGPLFWKVWERRANGDEEILSVGMIQVCDWCHSPTGEPRYGSRYLLANS